MLCSAVLVIFNFKILYFIPPLSICRDNYKNAIYWMIPLKSVTYEIFLTISLIVYSLMSRCLSSICGVGCLSMVQQGLFVWTYLYHLNIAVCLSIRPGVHFPKATMFVPSLSIEFRGTCDLTVLLGDAPQPGTATAWPVEWVWGGATCLFNQWQKGELFKISLKTIIIFIIMTEIITDNYHRNDALNICHCNFLSMSLCF